jgi:dihydroorotase
VAAVTRNVAGEELTEMIDLHHAGAIAFSDGEYPLWNTQVMLKALQYMQKFDGLLMNKPEDKHLNTFGLMHEGLQSTMLGMSGMPPLSEEIVVQRDLKLLAYARASATGHTPRLHFSNISTAEAVAHIREAKKRGLEISCDVAAHQLYYDDTTLASFDTNYKVNPPFRDQHHQKALLKGLQDGTIDVIVSSHSPQDEESKKCEMDMAAFGMIGLQTFFPLVNSLVSSSLPLEMLVEKFTEVPRRLLRLAVPKLEKGTDANLTLFSPEASWVFDNENNFSKSNNSPLLGAPLRGKALGIFNKERYWLDESFRS